MSKYTEIINALPDNQGYGFLIISGISLYRLKHAGNNTWYGVQVFQNGSDYKVKAVIGHIKSVDTSFGTQELELIVSDPDEHPLDVCNIGAALEKVKEKAKMSITRE